MTHIQTVSVKRRGPLNVSLTPELRRMVDRKVATGLYQTASEVIREALRLLKTRDEQDAVQDGVEGRRPHSKQNSFDSKQKRSRAQKGILKRSSKAVA